MVDFPAEEKTCVKPWECKTFHSDPGHFRELCTMATFMLPAWIPVWQYVLILLTTVWGHLIFHAEPKGETPLFRTHPLESQSEPDINKVYPKESKGRRAALLLGTLPLSRSVVLSATRSRGHSVSRQRRARWCCGVPPRVPAFPLTIKGNSLQTGPKGDVQSTL